jgi:hypothetical protein
VHAGPEDQTGLRSLRRTLYGCQLAVKIELLQMFVKHNAFRKERLYELLRNPRMKERRASQTWWLARLGLKYEDKDASKRSHER